MKSQKQSCHLITYATFDLTLAMTCYAVMRLQKQWIDTNSKLRRKKILQFSFDASTCLVGMYLIIKSHDCNPHTPLISRSPGTKRKMFQSVVRVTSEHFFLALPTFCSSSHQSIFKYLCTILLVLGNQFLILQPYPIPTLVIKQSLISHLGKDYLKVPNGHHA